MQTNCQTGKFFRYNPGDFVRFQHINGCERDFCVGVVKDKRIKRHTDFYFIKYRRNGCDCDHSKWIRYSCIDPMLSQNQQHQQVNPAQRLHPQQY